MSRKAMIDFMMGLLLTAMLTGGANSALCSQKPDRVVAVKIVADRKFASQEVWQRKAARQITDIAGEVRGLMGVDLKIVGYAQWPGDDTGDLYNLASNMIDGVPTGDADVLIGFTYGPCPDSGGGIHTDGMTIPFRGLVVRNYYPQCNRNDFIPYALIHELVHLFGGVHAGRGTLMSPVLSGSILLELDPINRAIVGLTRDIDFTRGYASLDQNSLNKLAELYRRATAQSGGDLTVLGDLAGVYRASGRYCDAIEIYRGILSTDSAATRTWLHIADCYFDENRSDSAFETLDAALRFTADSGRVYYRMARFYAGLGEYGQAYSYAAKAAWRGTAVDSALLEEIKSHFVPGEEMPEKRE